MGSWRINIIMATAIALIMVAMVVDAGDDKAKDKQECTEQLVGMATCLPYVQGQAKSPTPDCCSGLKQVLNTDMKCLCVIIQERNDPDLGLQVNVSLALALPSVCHATADITNCPALLHLDPNSPDAQVFYQLAKGLNNTGPASAPTGSAPEPTSMSPTAGSGVGNNSGRRTSVPRTNHAQSFSKRWLGLEVVAHFFVLLEDSCKIVSRQIGLLWSQCSSTALRINYKVSLFDMCFKSPFTVCGAKETAVDMERLQRQLQHF